MFCDSWGGTSFFGGVDWGGNLSWGVRSQAPCEGPRDGVPVPRVRGGFHPEMSGFSRVLGEGAMLPFSPGQCPGVVSDSPVPVTGDDQAE